ncbi:acyl-CoA dehydrogenase family protein [Granulicella rosea]|nr:acyl-CoA dehydrogenase [Granulicella rosea]
MHVIATAVIAAKATREQELRLLVPIAKGEHITTLALSESGSGVHFYLPRSELRQTSEGFEITGKKQFVTNAGYADSYVVSRIGGDDSEFSSVEFSCVAVERDEFGITVSGRWEGLGMRGNASRPITFNQVKVHQADLLGEVGDQIWYVFEVVAPYFLTAMAGTYLGIALAALDIAVEHVKSRNYESLRESLADVPVIQHQIAEMWAKVEQPRQLVYRAARLGDAGDPTALTAI